MTTAPVKPFLIAKDENGKVRLTVRETHYNSQGYPWVTTRLVELVFATASAARSFAVTELGAKPGEFSSR